MYRCIIYKGRPQTCRDHPKFDMKSVYPSCTYWFDDLERRRGECSRCGECCKVQKLYDGVCPYLEKVE